MGSKGSHKLEGLRPISDVDSIGPTSLDCLQTNNRRDKRSNKWGKEVNINGVSSLTKRKFGSNEKRSIQKLIKRKGVVVRTRVVFSQINDV